MASYEALEPGGHAHLVGKIKDYANRASGTGTTQVADGSVTSAKLSDGVQDALDEIAVSVDPMLKNGLRGTLPEGMLLTCNDSYAAPAHEVYVFGKSTQAGTPTPSAPVEIKSVGDTLLSHVTWAQGAIDTQGDLSNNAARIRTNQIFVATFDSVSISVGDGFEWALCAYKAPVRNSTNYIADESIRTWGSEPQTWTPTNAVFFSIVIRRVSGANITPDVDTGLSLGTAVLFHIDGKNVLNTRFTDEVTARDITYKANGDGSITFSTTNSSTKPNYVPIIPGVGFYSREDNYPVGVPLTIPNGAFQLPAGTYRLSYPDGLGVARLVLRMGDYNTSPDYLNSERTITTDGSKWFMIGAYVPDRASLYTAGATTRTIQLEVGSATTAYAPYIGQSVEIPLSNNSIRSLPDGTRDTLTLAYEGPSTREGWGVYSKTLTQNVDTLTLSDQAWTAYGTTSFYTSAITSMRSATSGIVEATSDAFAPYKSSTLASFGTSAPANSIGLNVGSKYILIKTGTEYSTAADFKASLSDEIAQFPLATPITHNLGTVELPILPNPMTAWADGGSAQPTISVTYERDVNIARANIISALAEIATS